MCSRRKKTNRNVNFPEKSEKSFIKLIFHFRWLLPHTHTHTHTRWCSADCILLDNQNEYGRARAPWKSGKLSLNTPPSPNTTCGGGGDFFLLSREQTLAFTHTRAQFWGWNYTCLARGERRGSGILLSDGKDILFFLVFVCSSFWAIQTGLSLCLPGVPGSGKKGLNHSEAFPSLWKEFKLNEVVAESSLAEIIKLKLLLCEMTSGSCFINYKGL